VPHQNWARRSEARRLPEVQQARAILIEVDRASGDRTKLAKKLRQYVNLYEAWDVDVDGETFPQVFYSVPDDDRRRVIHSVIKAQRYPSLFRVALFNEIVERLT
jgi:Uma2 family endonuclease